MLPDRAAAAPSGSVLRDALREPWPLLALAAALLVLLAALFLH